MATFFLILALLFFAGWVFAEFKAGKGARLTLGVVCMVMLIVGMTLDHVEAAGYFAKALMNYDQSLHHVVLLIDRDRAQDIPPALARYRATVYETRDHCSAAADLAQELGEAFRALEEKTDGSTQEK